MGLIDYAVQRDKFQADGVTDGLDFPCGVCIHRHGTDMEEPCRTCDHNMRSVPDDEVPNDQGKGQTPQAAVPLDPPVGREGD